MEDLAFFDVDTAVVAVTEREVEAQGCLAEAFQLDDIQGGEPSECCGE